MTPEAVTGAGLQAVFYTSLAFPVVTRFYWPWTSSRLGWSVSGKSVALAVVLAPYMLRVWFGPQPWLESEWAEWTVAVAIWLVPLVLLWRGWEIWRLQRDGAAADAQAEPERILP